MLAATAAFISLIGTGFSAYCHGKPNPSAPPNNFELQESNMQLLKQFDYEGRTNELYMAGNSEMSQTFYVAHVHGSPYAMGYAHGTMLKQEARSFIDDVWNYILSEVPYEQFFPEIVNATLEDLLDLQAEMVQPYTPDYWYEEMHGLADASGVPYESILRIHMLPELTKGSCSMFGAWGKATPSGGLLQLRALDWDVDGPFKDYPAIIVYHPSEYGLTFANIGFVGWIGSITGVNEKRVSISEIGVSYPDSTFGKETHYGYSFPFVLRDILQFDASVDDATHRLNTTHRTCYLILGAGSGPEAKFRGYEYSHSVLYAYDDTDMMPYNQTWHPRIENIVYWGMDWLCPGYSQVLGTKLEEYWGNVTSYNAWKNIVAETQTGNLHIALYDYPNDQLLVSFHKKSTDNSQYSNAYERPYTVIPLKSLFQEA